jgi:hypothetical protein
MTNLNFLLRLYVHIVIIIQVLFIFLIYRDYISYCYFLIRLVPYLYSDLIINTINILYFNWGSIRLFFLLYYFHTLRDFILYLIYITLHILVHAINNIITLNTRVQARFYLVIYFINFSLHITRQFF